VFYLDFLARLHMRLEPRTYLEFGIRNGWSLGVARCRSVGIDPSFAIDTEITAPTSLIRRTGDDYFASLDERGPFDGQPIDLAFIDGMHLFEFALRDFMNVERYAAWSSVAIFDDICPPNAMAAARDRVSMLWTGDVFKVENAITDRRPDIALVKVNTQPTGLLLAFALDPTNRALSEAYDDIVASYVRPDPQEVSQEILDRAGAVEPRAVLRSPLWEWLRENRDTLGADDGRAQLRDQVAALRAKGAANPSAGAAPADGGQRRKLSLRRQGRD